MGDKIESKKAAAKAKVSTVPGYLGEIADAREAVRDRRRDRLPRHDQGLGRRWRQRHARCLQRQGGGGRLRARPLGGQVELRRRSRVHREVHPEPAARRDPGAGRQAWAGALPGRARMLHPAPQPEGDRGGPLAAPRRQDPQGHGRAGRRALEGRRLRQRRHRGVRRRPGPLVLLPGDEHAPAGRASRDRARHRHRSRRADDPRRRRREAEDQAGGREAHRLGGRIPRLCRGPLPQLPALHRPPHPLSAAPGRLRARRHRSQRHRRVRGRRDLHVLRSHDRQAGDARGHARGSHRPAGGRARCLRHRRGGAQHPVSRRAHAAPALARGSAVDRLHRRGIQGWLQGARCRRARSCSCWPRSPSPSTT